MYTTSGAVYKYGRETAKRYKNIPLVTLRPVTVGTGATSVNKDDLSPTGRAFLAICHSTVFDVFLQYTGSGSAEGSNVTGTFL